VTGGKLEGIVDHEPRVTRWTVLGHRRGLVV
jgi:hypothetical protein